MNAIEISFDPARVDRDRVYGWIARESYWSRGIGRAAFERALDFSLVVGAYRPAEQVGFGRVITDRATSAWLSDFFVAAPARGRGIGSRMMAAVIAHPDLQGLRRLALRTRDAHELYARFGFVPLATPEGWMERYDPDPYRTKAMP